MVYSNCLILEALRIYRGENQLNHTDETMEPPLKKCRPKLLDSVKLSPPRKLNTTGKQSSELKSFMIPTCFVHNRVCFKIMISLHENFLNLLAKRTSGLSNFTGPLKYTTKSLIKTKSQSDFLIFNFHWPDLKFTGLSLRTTGFS
jgi:hypothetical protein